MDKTTIRSLTAASALIALLVLSAPALPGPAPAADDAVLAAKIDAVMAAVYKPGQPGAAIIVRRDGRTVLRKGYGLADLELGVPVAPDMVFRLGSVTKQFTAVAILMLAQEGRLGLRDEITRFLPDYPVRGRKITIEHLLTHTSGIQSYTDLPEWLPLWRKDMPLPELIGLFKDKPMQFEPGSRWAYNNSAYVLLGAVIEKVSGLSYERFLDERVFKPLGMAGTSYDHTERIVPRRVSGYQDGRDGFVNAPYLSMSQPYAAGALLSTVDDLAVWNEAVFSGRLVGREWLDKAFTPFVLTDGESSGYGYGWFIGDFAGHRSVEHGGGINGFTSYQLTLPEDRVFIAILTNSASAGRGPEPRAVQAAWLALGLAEPERKAVAVAARDLDAVAGVYLDARGQEYYFSREGDRLFAQRKGGSRDPLFAASATEFFLKDNPARFAFVKDAAGRATRLRLRSRIGPAQVFERTDKPLPSPRREVKLDPAKYDRLAGEYELAPDFTITILRRGDKLVSRATGQAEVELFPESETRFFLKVVDAQVDFTLDAAGAVTGLVLHQGGQDLPARKIRRP
jgi:CubicO group peptidase (beta-lactamase class C family)